MYIIYKGVINLEGKIFKAVHFAVSAKNLYSSCHISAYAAKASFFILLSAVPMTALVVTVTATVLQLDTPFAAEWLGVFLKLKWTEAVKEVSAHMAGQLTGNKGLLTVLLSFGVLIWSATKGVRSIAGGINAIYCDSKKGIVDMAVRSAIYTLFMALALILSFGMLVMASPLEKLITSLFGTKGGVLIMVINTRNIIVFLLLWLLFGFAYRFLGGGRMSFAKHMQGAALAAVGWIAVSFGYSVYIKYFYRYPVVYGSFCAVVLFMMWLYICMNILLCGALVNRIKWQKGNNCD